MMLIRRRMKITSKMKLDDLYFGVVMNPMSYTKYSDRNNLTTYNIFDSYRVKWSVATYVAMTAKKKAEVSDPLRFCFGDTWGRTEWEFIVCPWPYTNEDTIDLVGKKVDIFSMYVEPNAELLMDLVNRVTKTSAKAWLKAEKERRKQ